MERLLNSNNNRKCNSGRCRQSTIRAFSLLETLVSIAVTGVIIFMLNSVVVNLTIISQKTLARSTIREEISAVMDQMVTDIRNADSVTNCSGATPSNVRCDVVGRVNVAWTNCGTSICKTDLGASQVIYRTSSNLNVISFSIEDGPAVAGNLTQRNILITISGSHTNTKYGVNNVYRQVSVSTRNYAVN